MGDNFMSIQDTIRLLRETNRWSQEEMAEKLGMSHNGYAKIERGETKLYLEKLNQIAQIFNIDLSDLISDQEHNVFFLLNETHDHTSANYYSNDNTVGFELEKLKMTVRHLEEIIIQKDREIAAQGEIIALLKGQKEEVVGL